jgi:hypothetical protein
MSFRRPYSPLNSPTMRQRKSTIISLETLSSKDQRASVVLRRIPNPSHRHAAPSGPWPWVDECDLAEALDELNDLDSKPGSDAPTPLVPCRHKECDDCPSWNTYPQSLFGNWTPKPVAKCKIADVVVNSHSSTCIIRHVDVQDTGVFEGHGKEEVSQKNVREYWRNFMDAEVSCPASKHASLRWYISVKEVYGCGRSSLNTCRDPFYRCLAPSKFCFFPYRPTY